jgi:hypothetical protein
MKSLSLLLLAGMMGMAGCASKSAPHVYRICVGFSQQSCEMVFSREGGVDKAMSEALQALPPGSSGVIDIGPGPYTVTMSVNPLKSEAK